MESSRRCVSTSDAPATPSRNGEIDRGIDFLETHAQIGRRQRFDGGGHALGHGKVALIFRPHNRKRHDIPAIELGERSPFFGCVRDLPKLVERTFRPPGIVIEVEARRSTVSALARDRMDCSAPPISPRPPARSVFVALSCWFTSPAVTSKREQPPESRWACVDHRLREHPDA